MICWLDPERLYAGSRVSVFIGMNLGIGDEKDEVETWYFQDTSSFYSKGAYRKDFETSNSEERLYSLPGKTLQVVNCGGLAAPALESAERRAASGKSA